ncbi:MAG: DNA polymerase A family protein, partial [Dehalococcoidia bacterium]
INTTAVGAGLVDFNPGSPKQLSDLLYGRLGLSPTKLTPTGSPSTDKESLLELERQHPVVGDVLKWRAMSKLHSTYAQPLPGFVRSDGRIHPSVRIDGARSGRPSCSEPNLYNVPRATDDLSRFARDCFVAPPGSVLVSFDYKQLELYVAAIESGDEVMIEMLRSGEDFHLSTARLISRQLWGIAPEDVPEKGAERSAAKAVNFGLLYGMGTGTLAHRLGVSYQRAEETVRAIMGQFKQLDRYRRELIVRARRTGEAWTRWNGEPFRCRPLWRIADVDSEVRSRAENASLNTPIQAFASDFCEFSIVEVVRWLLRTGFPAKLVLSVYDSIMLEVGEARAAELVDEVGEIMTSWPTGYDGFRLRVDVEVGESWGSLEPWEKTLAGA